MNKFDNYHLVCLRTIPSEKKTAFLIGKTRQDGPKEFQKMPGASVQLEAIWRKFYKISSLPVDEKSVKIFVERPSEEFQKGIWSYKMQLKSIPFLMRNFPSAHKAWLLRTRKCWGSL